MSYYKRECRNKVCVVVSAAACVLVVMFSIGAGYAIPKLHAANIPAVAACPLQYDHHPLVSFGLYGGPPSEMGDLEPEAGVWDLSSKYPEGYFIGCRYMDTSFIYSIGIPIAIRNCRILTQTLYACR